LSARHEQGLRRNNRAENSHQPARRLERKNATIQIAWISRAIPVRSRRPTPSTSSAISRPATRSASSGAKLSGRSEPRRQHEAEPRLLNLLRKFRFVRQRPRHTFVLLRILIHSFRPSFGAREFAMAYLAGDAHAKVNESIDLRGKRLRSRVYLPAHQPGLAEIRTGAKHGTAAAASVPNVCRCVRRGARI
jgi:hypothetical protein